MLLPPGSQLSLWGLFFLPRLRVALCCWKVGHSALDGSHAVGLLSLCGIHSGPSPGLSAHLIESASPLAVLWWVLTGHTRVHILRSVSTQLSPDLLTTRGLILFSQSP